MTVKLIELRTRPVTAFLVVAILFAAEFPSRGFAQHAKVKNALQLMQDRHRNRFREFSAEIEKLAKFCDDKGLDEAAQKVRSRLIVLDPQRVDRLPTEVRPDISPSVTGDERHWQTQLRFLENDYAKDLYIQSRQALNPPNGNASYAFDLIREAAIHNPDNAHVRRILGYVQLVNEWVTPFAHSQIKKGNVWHEEFGWLPKSYVPRYIAGERNFRKGWITAEKERELRRDFKSAWEVRTDHYLIKTNVSLEKGVELGKSLEDFYGVFIETFAGFFHTQEQLQARFNETARNTPLEVKPYEVHFYRTRDEYIEKLREFFPSIEQTNGVYMTSGRTAHFYYDPDNDHSGTLFHEATHQLFFESFANRTICDNHHFWIIEGIACYMESFQSKGGSFSLGDPNYIRFAGARHNLLENKFYVPLREFSGYGMKEFQTAPELKKIYTQAAGLARFFMHYDNGRYREALVTHLSQLYSNDERIRDKAKGLDELTGVDFTELDSQYAADARVTEKEADAK